MGGSCSCAEEQREAVAIGSLKTRSSDRFVDLGNGVSGSESCKTQQKAPTKGAENISGIDKKYKDTIRAFLERNCLSCNSDMVPASKMNETRLSVMAAIHRIGSFEREERIDALFKDPEIRIFGPLQSKTTGHTYTGEMLNGVPHGYGVFVGSNGVYIEGYFLRGFPEYKILKVWKTLEAYNGEWSNNMRNGFGAYLNLEAEVAQGCWEDNKMHGNMKISNKEDEILFEGKMIRNRKEGRCYFRDPKKKMAYFGDFRDGLFYGEGRLSTAEGVFEGTFALGRKNGFGILTTKSGEEISGEWSNDKLIDPESRDYQKKSSLDSVETKDSAQF